MEMGRGFISGQPQLSVNELNVLKIDEDDD